MSFINVGIQLFEQLFILLELEVIFIKLDEDSIDITLKPCLNCLTIGVKVTDSLVYFQEHVHSLSFLENYCVQVVDFVLLRLVLF